MERLGPKACMKIGSVELDQHDIDLLFIIVDKQKHYRTKNGSLLNPLVVGDETGTINLVVWDVKSELLLPGDVYRLRGGYTVAHEGRLTMHIGRKGSLQRIDEFTMTYNPSLDKYKSKYSRAMRRKLK